MRIGPDTILEYASIGVMGIDTHGSIHYTNHRIQQLFDCDTAIGSSLETIDPDLAEKALSCINLGKTDQTFHIKRQGGDLEVQVSLMITDNGTKGAVCFLRNLETVEASAMTPPNINDMSLQFQALMDHSYYGIYILDGQGTVLKVNDVAADLIGIKKKDVIGINIRNLVKMGIIDKSLTPSILKTKKPLTRPLYVKKSNK
jgi:transcriptional regulator with PAS, ATPase and Fis domain